MPKPLPRTFCLTLLHHAIGRVLLERHWARDNALSDLETGVVHLAGLHSRTDSQMKKKI